MYIVWTVAQPASRAPTIYGTMQSMETWDAIRARRNVRAYTDQPLSSEDLARTLEVRGPGAPVRRGGPPRAVVRRAARRTGGVPEVRRLGTEPFADAYRRWLAMVV
jgi:hypothetical protein